MKKQLLFFLTVFALIGCKVDENSEGIEGTLFFTDMSKAPSSLVLKENLPGWLLALVNTYESSYVISWESRVYQGTWEHHPVFSIRLGIHSHGCGDLYLEDGTEIPLDGGDLQMRFLKESKNWKLIYELECEPFTKSALSK